MNKLIILAILCIHSFAMAQFSGGDGTDTNPFQIKTATELTKISTELESHFILMNDITLTDSWSSIGGVLDPFKGSINGDGYTISGLEISGSDYAALIGNANGATFKNIDIIDCKVEGEEYVGALVGNLSTTSNVSNCHVTGSVKGDVYVGGLIGKLSSNSTIDSSNFSGMVTGINSIGGLVGESYDSNSIINCNSTGDINATGSLIGGLIGFSYKSLTSKSYSNCNITGTNEVGGLIGKQINGTISQCFFSGNLSATDELVGGLIGSVEGDSIINCFNTAEIHGKSSVGGISGIINNTVLINSYSIGSTTCDEDTLLCGGLIGDESGINSIINSYYSIEGSYGCGNNLGSKVSVNDLKNELTLPNWDFENIWSIKENITYPQLKIFEGILHTVGEEFLVEQTVLHSELLVNDISYNSSNNLILTILSTEKCVSNGNSITFLSSTNVGDTAYVKYRIGEVTNTDTIWAPNTDNAIIIRKNTVPNITSITSDLSFTVLDTFQVSMTDITVSEPDTGLSIVLETTDPNCVIIGTTIASYKYFVGDVALTVSLTDGVNVSNKYEIIVKINPIVVPYFAGGNGSKETPYLIENVYQLYNLKDFTYEDDNDTSCYFELVNDLDFSTTIYSEHWEPIASGDEGFNGHFNGKGHTISNLNITASKWYQHTGLFGHVNNGSIDSVGLINGNITGDQHVGLLAGNLSTNSSMENSYANGTVYGAKDVGGLIGKVYDNSHVSDSYFKGTVNGGNSTGGLTGLLIMSSTINNCFSEGNITATSIYTGGLVGLTDKDSKVDESFSLCHVTNTDGFVGGLIGRSKNSYIVNSYALGDVYSEGFDVGGLIGYADSLIENCYAKGYITSDASIVGGLIGVSQGYIKKCYALGNVNVLGNYVGGLVGDNQGETEDSFATGNVSGEYRCGGLIGQNLGTISRCYSTGNVVGNDGSGGFVGYSSSTITDSYSTGNVTVNSSASASGFTGNGSSLVYTSYTSGKAKTQKTFSLPGEKTYEIGNSISLLHNSYYDSEVAESLSDTSSNALTTSEMMHKSSYKDWDFLTIWDILDGYTYPVIKSIDNAPFAFVDTIIAGASVSFESFIENDCDFETQRNNLVARVDSSYGCKPLNGYVYISDSLNIDDTAYVVYRVGEVREATNDTLWGNTVTSLVVKAVNSTPILTSVSSTLQVESGETITINLSDVVSSDSDGDPLFIVVSSTDPNCTIDGNTIIPDSSFTGDLTVLISVSDGSSISNAITTTIAVESEESIVLVSTPETLTFVEGEIITINLSDVVVADSTATDLYIVLSSTDTNCTIDGNTVIPKPSFTGDLTVLISVTDGEIISNAISTIITVESQETLILVSTSSTLTVVKGETCTVSLSDVVVSGSISTDLYIVLSSIDTNCTIDGNTIIPDSSFTGDLTVLVSVTDGAINSNVISTTITVEAAAEEESEEEESAVNEIKPFIEDGFSLRVAPTPTQEDGKIFYSVKKSGRVKFTLFNSNEKIVATSSVAAWENENLVHRWMVISKLPKGTYYVVMSLNGEKKGIVRLIKL